MIKYIAGKSNNTWYQKPPIARAAYKEKLGYDKCNICKKYFGLSRLTLDHIIPISYGGPVDDIGNMQLLCYYCHDAKTRAEK
jgi:5-methylcytosine-specific restriction endonuclease McrA